MTFEPEPTNTRFIVGVFFFFLQDQERKMFHLTSRVKRALPRNVRLVTRYLFNLVFVTWKWDIERRDWQGF